MTPPSRAQIEAVVALPKYKIEVDQGAGYVAIDETFSAYVKSINANLETTNNQDNAFAFGTVATVTAHFELADNYSITDWKKAKVRISFGFDTSDYVIAFEGIIVKRTHNERLYEYECEGFNYIIARKKIYTEVFYRRPIATKTTTTSLENYTAFGARPGLLNIIFYSVGGRPYEQPGYATDPDFKFWYSFDESIVKPRWSWISGEDAWEETQRLVRAAGGQLYQDVDGVIYYKQPLSFGETTGVGLYDFNYNTFQTIQEESSTVEELDTIKAQYIERVLQPMQEIYNSSKPYLIANGDDLNVPLEMQYPIYSYASYTNAQRLIASGAAIKATFLDGRDAHTDPDFTVAINTRAAQLLDLTFSNNTGEPIVINKIALQGRPITAGSESVATYTNGTGESELMLEDNVYIQSFAQAYRLVRMYYDFYNTNKAIITLDGVGYDPDRYLGEVVTITYSDWGLSASQHRIIGLDYSDGATMTVKLAPIDGLPTRDDMFIVGSSYADATVKQVSY